MTPPGPPRHSRLRWQRAALALALAVATSACASDEPAAEHLPTVRFAFIPAVDHLSYLVMVDRGFDRENGFRLEETDAVGGRAALDAIAAGDADATMSGSVQALADARAGLVPATEVIVGNNTYADQKHPAMAMLVGSGIDGWSDLVGATIAVNQIGSLAEVAGRIRLAQEGVTGVTFAEIALPDQGLAVADGAVAAAIMSEPYLTQSSRRGDGTILDWVIGGAPFPEFPYTVIVVRGSLARDDPGLVRAFLRAHLEAVRWIDRHDGAARDLLARRLSLEPAVAEEMRVNPYVADARFDRDLLDRVQQILAAADPAATPVAVADLIDERLLGEVLSGAGG